jgi:hypothetical protein
MHQPMNLGITKFKTFYADNGLFVTEIHDENGKFTGYTHKNLGN